MISTPELLLLIGKLSMEDYFEKGQANFSLFENQDGDIWQK